MNGHDRCRLCGNGDKREIGTSLAHWRVALPGMAYEHVIRCLDRPACKRRVEQAKKPWPLVEEASDRSGAA